MQLPHYAVSLFLAICSTTAISYPMTNGSQPLPEIAQRNLVLNDISGGSGGERFIGIAPNNETVRNIELHCADYHGNWIIRGMQLEYTDGSTSDFFGSPSDRVRSHRFDDNETVETMNIKATDRADAIQMRTTTGWFSECGDGGSDHQQDVGNGKLVGFWGRNGFDIDALGAIFEQ